MTRYDAWKLASPPEPTCADCRRDLEDIAPDGSDLCYACIADRGLLVCECCGAIGAGIDEPDEIWLCETCEIKAEED